VTEEQQLLIQKAREQVEFARQLAAQTALSQPAIDAIAHNAYYAMLHLADALLRGEGIIRNSHGAIVAAFGEHLAKPGRVPREVHRYLIDAKDARETADYQVRRKITLPSAREHLAHAEDFLDLDRRLLGEVGP